MKVKELIAELEKQDPESDVVMFDGPSIILLVGYLSGRVKEVYRVRL